MLHNLAWRAQYGEVSALFTCGYYGLPAYFLCCLVKKLLKLYKSDGGHEEAEREKGAYWEELNFNIKWQFDIESLKLIINNTDP